jgi:hypothetical protein
MGIPYHDVSGVLVTCRYFGTPVDTSVHINVYNRNWEAALFANSTGDSLTSAGTVSINGTPLNDGPYGSITGNMYFHRDTTIMWNDSTVNQWTVSGGRDIPAFIATINGTYPSFTGTLPDTISKTTDFSFTFNASNAFNADSAYVLIYSRFYGDPVKSKVVSAAGGVVSIPFNYFSSFTNGYMSLNEFKLTPVYSGGGSIAVVLLKQSIQTFGGKKFAFIQQKVTLGIVSFI